MKKVLAAVLSAALLVSVMPGMSSFAAAKKTASAPTSNYKSGAYGSDITVKLKSATSGVALYYTTDRKAPTAKSHRYRKALVISHTTYLRVIAIKKGYKNSKVMNFSYAFTKLSGNITADGSTALQPLLTASVPLFSHAYRRVFKSSISIQGGGSGQGLTDVASGVVKIGDSDVTPDQIGADGTGLVDHKVCVVAVGIAVSDNVASHISNIKTAELKKVFNGTYSNWNQLSGWTGGSLPIQVYYRKPNSGTRVLFETYGSQASLSDAQLASLSNFTRKDSSGDLETAISNQSSSAGAIGYETLPYCKNLKLLKVNGIDPTYANVYTGDYPIWGYEHMYTKGAADKTAQAFIDYITSADFASTVTANGYGLITSMKVNR